MALQPPYVRPRRLWLLRVPIRFSPPQCRFDHDASGVLNFASMLAVLCSSPRPPLGVAIIGLTIAMLSWVLHLLPYIMFCGMVTLSIWPSSHPPPLEVIYHPVDGLPNHVHVVYTRVGTKKATPFELNAELRFLVFLLSIPVTSVVETALFYPARRFFLQTIECWFEMRYVHPAQLTGSWPDTCTPIFNALRSYEFVADFIDSVMSRNSGTNLAPTAEPHTSGPCVGPDASGGSHSTVQPTEQSVPSRQYERTSDPDSIVHDKPEYSTNVPRARKTFISPPRVSSQSPWKANGLGGVSKNLSRIVGTLFHHPPPRKPVLRRRINLMAKVPSPRVPPHVLERLYSRNEDNTAPAWAPIPSLDSVVPWHDGAQLLRSAWDHVSNHLVTAAAPEHITERSLPPAVDSQLFPGTCEALQTQFEQQQCWGYAHSPITSPLHHGSPHVQEPSHQGFQSVAPLQHGSHAFSNGPELPVAVREPEPQGVFGKHAPLASFSSLAVAPQEKFTFQLLDYVPLFQFSEDAPRFCAHNTPPAGPMIPEMACTADGYANTAVFVPCSTSTSQIESSRSSSQPVPYYHNHQSPTIASPVLQQPFWNLGVTGTFTFEVSQVTPYFDFSHHVPPPPQPHHGIKLDVAPQAATGTQPSPAKHAGSTTGDIATLNAGPSTTGAKMTVDGSDDDDDYNSDSDSSDSSDSESDSDSDMDSDSDSDDDTDTDTDSEDEEDDAMATETVCKTSSRAPDASSNVQDVVQRVSASKDASAPSTAASKDDSADSDSDSDGYFEHVSTPAIAGASNDDDDDSSTSDEDMSDHEEEDRLYWEMLYAPRHQRQPQVSVGSI